LILKISFRDSIFLVGSVYGPTVSQDPDFMVNLKRDILSFGNHEFLIGGDLNMVTDANAITATSVCWVELYILNLDVYLSCNPRRYYYLCLLCRIIYFEFRCVSVKQP